MLKKVSWAYEYGCNKWLVLSTEILSEGFTVIDLSDLDNKLLVFQPINPEEKDTILLGHWQTKRESLLAELHRVNTVLVNDFTVVITF